MRQASDSNAGFFLYTAGDPGLAAGHRLPEDDLAGIVIPGWGECGELDDDDDSSIEEVQLHFVIINDVSCRSDCVIRIENPMNLT